MKKRKKQATEADVEGEITYEFRQTYAKFYYLYTRIV